MSSHEPTQEEWHVMANHATKEKPAKSTESAARLTPKYDEDEHRRQPGDSGPAADVK